MKQVTLRQGLRWLHLILGLLVMCYIYSPFGNLRAFQITMKFIIIPVIVLTGIWIWKFKEINKKFRIK